MVIACEDPCKFWTLIFDIIRTLATVGLMVGMWKRWFVDERKLQVERQKAQDGKEE